MLISDFFGWVGTVAYALCAAPQIMVTIKTGKVTLSELFIFLYLTGATLSFIYAVHATVFISAFSFLIAIISWSIILKYKFWGNIKTWCKKTLG